MKFKKTNLLYFIVPIFIPLIIVVGFKQSNIINYPIMGHIYQQNCYFNYGYSVIAYQDNKKEKRTSSYNGAVPILNINPQKPYKIEVYNNKNQLQTIITLNSGRHFTVRLPQQPQYTKLVTTIIGLISTIFFLSIFIIILIREKKPQLGIPFSIAILGPFVFYLVTFIQMIMANIGQETAAGNIFAFHRLGYLFLPASYYHFCYSLSTNNKPSSNLLKIIYVPALFSIPILLSWIVLGNDLAYLHFWGFSFNLFNQIFSIYIITCLLWGLSLLIHKTKNSTARHTEKKLKNIIIGISVSFSIFIILLVIPQLILLPEFFDGYYDLIILLTQLILFSTLTYGIVKNHLIDFNLIINKTLVYFILSLCFTSLYVICLNSFIFTSHPQNMIIFSTLLIIVLFAILEPLRFFLQRHFNHVFFPEQNIMHPAIIYYNQHIATALDKDRIFEQSSLLFSTHFKVDKIMFFLYDNSSLLLKNTDKSSNNNYQLNETTANGITALSFITTLDERIYHDLRPLQEIFQATRSQAIGTLTFQNELIGIITFARYKKEFTRSELKLISNLCANVTLAIINSNNNEKIIDSERKSLQSDKLASIGKITASIAHEIKNPLSAIIPLVKALPDMGKEPDFMKDFMDIVPRQLERIDSKIRNLLSFAKPGTGIKEELYIENIIEETTRLYAHQMTKKNIKLHIVLEKSETMRVSREDMISVFNNLILNAIEAIGNNGLITITSENKNGNKTIRIIDTGKGIEPAIMPRIFEPFQTTKQEGTGIGLFTVKQIIRSYEGQVTVKSDVETGTEFTITLPLMKH